MTAGVLTVSDVVARVERTFGDESGVQVTQDDIIRWINDAQREAVMQNEGLLQTIGYVSTVAGIKEYALPADQFTLHHLYVKDTGTTYYALKYYSLKEFTEYVDGWDSSDIVYGYPLIYTKQQNGMVVLFPAPTSSVANGIKMIYSRYATDVVDTDSTIDLPPYLHTYIVNFSLMQAYEMDEDWESAQQKAAQIQGDLDFNNNRGFWFGREAYPTIATDFVDWEDYG